MSGDVLLYALPLVATLLGGAAAGAGINSWASARAVKGQIVREDAQRRADRLLDNRYEVYGAWLAAARDSMMATMTLVTWIQLDDGRQDLPNEGLREQLTAMGQTHPRAAETYQQVLPELQRATARLRLLAPAAVHRPAADFLGYLLTAPSDGIVNAAGLPHEDMTAEAMRVDLGLSDRTS